MHVTTIDILTMSHTTKKKTKEKSDLGKWNWLNVGRYSSNRTVLSFLIFFFLCPSNDDRSLIINNTGELKFEYADVDYDSDAEIKRMKTRKTQVILGKSDKDSWNKALLRAQGMKVKDNEKLIEKSKKKKLVLKKKSIKVWDERKKQLQERMEKRQKKRENNINKRKEQKMATKAKRRSKR